MGKIRALRPTLIERLGLQGEVFELRKQGYGIKKIVEILSDRHRKSFTYYHIKSFLDRNLEKMMYYLKDDPRAVEEAKSQLNETMMQFKRLNEEAWEYFNKLKQDNKMDIRRLKAMETILKMLKFYDERITRVTEGASSPKTLVQKTNIINVTQNIDRTISYFEDQGMILVNKEDYENLKREHKAMKKKLGYVPKIPSNK